MGHTRNNSASHSGTQKEESIQFVECNGLDGNGMMGIMVTAAQTTGRQRSSSKTLSQRPSSLVVHELEKKSFSGAEDMSAVIETDSNEEYCRWKNEEIFGADEDLDQDVSAKVVSVAEKTSS